MYFSKWTYGIFIIGISVLLSSCYIVSTIETDVLKPAKINFSPEVYNVGVISRMDLDIKRTAGKINSQEEIAFKRDSTFLKNAVMGLLDGLAESPRFDAFKVATRRVLTGGSAYLNVPLSWDLVEVLADRNDLDLLISLTAANYKDTVQKPIELFRKETLEKSSGKNSVTDSNRNQIRYSKYDTYIMFPQLFWRLYDLRKREVSQYILIDTLYYAYGPNKGYPTDEQVLKYFYDALGDVSYEYSRYLAPYWKTESRDWYPSGNRYFDKAADLVFEDKWAEASKIWIKLAESENPKLASRACFNMAVAAEMMDRLELALIWIDKSKELGLKYYPENYREIINKRIKDRAALDIQMK